MSVCVLGLTESGFRLCAAEETRTERFLTEELIYIWSLDFFFFSSWIWTFPPL